MGIKIKPGKTEQAKKELDSFIMAYPVNCIGNENDMILYWLPSGREDESACFEDMQLNQYCGTFDVVAYLGL
jgi:hypothetical protein